MTAALIIGLAWIGACILLSTAWAIFRAPIREWENQQLHEDASMRAQRRRELYDRNRAQEEAARPDAEIVEFPHRGPAA